MPLQRRHGAAILNQARAHIDAGELSAARGLLSEVLATLPPDPRTARPNEAEAVTLQTGVLLSLGDAHAARGWAAYGHATFRRLYGEHDRRTLHALGLLAAVLTRVGAHGRAAQRYQHLIDIFTDLDGPEAGRTLAARADLATVEHARGHCAEGRGLLAAVIGEHQKSYGAAHPVGVRMRARLAAMWRDCGDRERAHSLLARARADATGLDPQVIRLLDAAAGTPADPHHLCGVADHPEPQQPESSAAPVPSLSGELVERPREPATPESPLVSPFSTVSYLPAHPLLVAWEPLPPERPVRSVSREIAPSTFALIAAVVGIVAVAVLFLLLVSAVRGD